jgi:hypothetical protein
MTWPYDVIPPSHRRRGSVEFRRSNVGGALLPRRGTGCQDQAQQLAVDSTARLPKIAAPVRALQGMEDMLHKLLQKWPDSPVVSAARGH